MRLRHKSLILLLMATAAACRTSPAFGSLQPVHAPHGIVVSAHELASRAGVEIMQAGGNAVDAAAATGFALAVVHPAAGNLGGGGFMLIRLADGKTHFLDYREKAPAAATRDMYLDSHGDVVGGASELGYKAIGVPGSVAGMVYADQKYGKLTLQQVMAPAIRLAREGYVLSWGEARDLHDKHLAEFAESRRIFQRDGHYYQPGEIFRQPDLARTLERIAAKPDDFYHGRLAQELARAIEKGGGLITPDDLAHYEVKEREPIRGTYRGYEVISAPPPSSGGTVLLESLNILEGYDLAKLGDRSAESIHFTTEAFRRAFFDRAEFLGDPDFAKIPVAQLIRQEIWCGMAGLHRQRRARPQGKLKRPPIFTEWSNTRSCKFRNRWTFMNRRTPRLFSGGCEGDAVAVTTTINGWFGSRVTADGLGFLMNEQMDDFSAKSECRISVRPDSRAANAIGPQNVLSRHNATIVVVRRESTPLVLGPPEVRRLSTTLANVSGGGIVDYGMNIGEAVDAPRFQSVAARHAERGAMVLTDTVQVLKKMGYNVEFGLHDGEDVSPYWSEAECIAIDPKTGERLGASDYRTNGRAVGY